MEKSGKYAKLANSLLEIIEEVGRKKVPPGMIGFVGELFTLSKMYADEELKSRIQYFGGRHPYDIEVGKKKILIKTNLYSEEVAKKTYGVDEGFLWSDLRVEKITTKKGKLIKRQIDFDFVVLVGIRNKQPMFYVLTKEEFMDDDTSSNKFGWRRAKGTRVIAVIEKRDDERYKTLTKTRKEYVDYFSRKEIIDLFKKSEDAWGKIKNCAF